jgi:hypothetical protein
MSKTIRILILLLVFFVLLFTSLIIWMVKTNNERDLQCKQQFGMQYSYTSRDSIDCIDNQGNGKYLKNVSWF